MLCTLAALASGCGGSDDSPPADPTITTIAGVNNGDYGYADGDASSALFDQPEGLALDAAGANLYIADSYNHAIRRLDLTTMQVTTIAGVGGMSGSADTTVDAPALLKIPRNLVLSPSGDALYVTDTGNHTIRRIDLATLEVRTPYGTAGEAGSTDGIGTSARFGSAALLSPWTGGMVIDPATSIMYVADSGNQTIRAIDLTTDEVTTLAGQVGVIGAANGDAATATFNKPTGLALDGTGGLWIAEANNIDIRRLDLATRQVTTMAGKAPDDPTHFCENLSPVIPPECGDTDAPVGTDARFRFRFGVAVDNAGGMFVVDSHSNIVRHVDFASTAVTTVAGVPFEILDDVPHASQDSADGVPGTFWHPSHVAFSPPNVLYVADRSAMCIRRVELLAP